MINVTTATVAELIAFYNANVAIHGMTAVKKFADRKTAERRCGAVVALIEVKTAADAQVQAERDAANAAAAEQAAADAAALAAAATPKKAKAGADARAAAQQARDAIRAARFPSAAAKTTVTKAGATVTTKPASSAEIRATVAGTTAPVKAAAKPAAAPSKLDAQRVTLTLSLANPKAGQRGFFASDFLPAVIDAQDEQGNVVAADVFIRFPAKTRAQLADAWAYLTQEGFAERI